MCHVVDAKRGDDDVERRGVQAVQRIQRAARGCAGSCHQPPVNRELAGKQPDKLT